MYRIVHNQQTDSYRVEKRGFLGWNFVSDEITGDYLQFGDLDAAQRWMQSACGTRNQDSRRWKVVTECHA